MALIYVIHTKANIKREYFVSLNYFNFKLHETEKEILHDTRTIIIFLFGGGVTSCSTLLDDMIAATGSYEPTNVYLRGNCAKHDRRRRATGDGRRATGDERRGR